MRMRTLFISVAVLALVVSAALAADLNGKWKAESPGRDGQVRTTTFTFKVDGDKLTGSVSGRQNENPISEGKISGDEISFVVVRNMGGEERKIQYKGTVSGDEIKLSVTFSPDMPAREMVAKRVKE